MARFVCEQNRRNQVVDRPSIKKLVRLRVIFRYVVRRLSIPSATVQCAFDFFLRALLIFIVMHGDAKLAQVCSAVGYLRGGRRGRISNSCNCTIE